MLYYNVVMTEIKPAGYLTLSRIYIYGSRSQKSAIFWKKFGNRRFSGILCRQKIVFLQFSGAIFHRKNNIFIDAYTLPLEQAYNFSLPPTILISRFQMYISSRFSTTADSGNCQVERHIWVKCGHFGVK